MGQARVRQNSDPAVLVWRRRPFKLLEVRVVAEDGSDVAAGSQQIGEVWCRYAIPTILSSKRLVRCNNGETLDILMNGLCHSGEACPVHPAVGAPASFTTLLTTSMHLQIRGASARASAQASAIEPQALQ